MKPVGQRLKELRKRTGLSLRGTARLLEMPPSSYQYYEDDFKDKFLPIELVRKLTAKFEEHGVSVKELYALAGAEDLLSSAEFSPAQKDNRTIPVIDYVAAGRFDVVTDPFPEGGGYEYLSTDLPLSKHAFALIIQGDSMSPIFVAGDKVVMDPEIQPLPGDYVVAKLDEEEAATFKRYRPRGKDRDNKEIIELVPENPDYPTLRIDAANPGRIVATMVEHRRRRRPIPVAKGS